ncbi:hypothetical protein ACJVDH_08275 [Pedobacter sp. AW1-32]|uniref:hypothetical protein n=1 Tax=Pedobacter sp. AW1-32 TaxID=3383026 RepID=UPI003FF0FF7B
MSTENLDELSALDVRIAISQDLTSKKKNDVSVYIYDKDGRSIRNKKIKISANKVALSYIERQELYYTTTSKYLLDNVPVEKGYELQITLPNGKTYFLGKIEALAKINPGSISCELTGDLAKDFVIYWKGLSEITELSMTKGVLLRNSTQLHRNFDYQPLFTRKISSNGKYILSRSNYVDSRSKIHSLEIRFSAEKSGIVNSRLLRGSEIKISGHIDRLINFNQND